MMLSGSLTKFASNFDAYPSFRFNPGDSYCRRIGVSPELPTPHIVSGGHSPALLVRTSSNSKLRCKVATAVSFRGRYSSSGVTAGRMRAERRTVLLVQSTRIPEIHLFRRSSIPFVLVISGSCHPEHSDTNGLL